MEIIHALSYSCMFLLWSESNCAGVYQSIAIAKYPNSASRGGIQSK